MVLNFTTIRDNSGKDFDSKPAKIPLGIHRSETWLKNTAHIAYLHSRQFLGLDRIKIQNEGF